MDARLAGIRMRRSEDLLSAGHSTLSPPCRSPAVATSSHTAAPAIVTSEAAAWLSRDRKEYGLFHEEETFYCRPNRMT